MKYNDFKDNDSATLNYQRWQNGQQYLNAKGLTTTIPQCVDFYEGRQWANVTENTKHIPRPVINMISKVVTNKQSNILSSPVHLNFRADNDEDTTEKFTKFASYQMKEMQQEWYNALAINDGLVKGTYVYHYYWDDKAIGKKGIVQGGIKCEIIDPLNVVVANPIVTDCQKQKWIMIRSREEVNAVKAMCENPQDAERITTDSKSTNYSNEIEQEGDNLVYVYTRYFKKDNEVYFEKSTQSVDIHKPRPLNPYISLKELEKKSSRDDEESKTPEIYDIDPQRHSTPDESLEDESLDEFEYQQTKFSYYPIEIGTLSPRDKSIYGLSEVEPLIETQKAVNFQLSMILLNAQSQGWGKYIVKAGALKGQKITNQPGQVLVDFSPVGSWGIKPMEGQQFSNGAFDIINQIIELTRMTTNSTDVVTGDQIKSDLSGTAIAQIQAQGQKPIEQMQKRFWRSLERIGKILECFYKLYYENVPYSYEINESEVDKRYQEMLRLAKEEGYRGELPPVSRSAEGIFNGADYEHTAFNIVVEAGKGTQYSELMEMDFANNLILNGNIDKISPDNLELLIEMYPESAIPNKADLKRYIRRKQQSQIAQLQEKLTEASSLLSQAANELQQKDGQLQAMSEYLKGMKKEFSDKITAQNDEISKMSNFMKNTPYSNSTQDLSTTENDLNTLPSNS